jgi:hypothetical protein
MTIEAGRVHPRVRKRTWLLLTLFAAILTATVWSALGGPGLDRTVAPDLPPIPNPNGYDDVLEAGREVEKSGLTGAKFDLDKMDQAALEPVVQGTREAVARGRKGLDKSFQVPVVYDLKQMMNVLLADLGSIRGGLVRALLAQGRLAELQEHIDLAAGCYADAIRLGQTMSHRVPMIVYLVGAAVQSAGLHHLRDLRARLSPEKCREMIALLEASDHDREPIPDVTLRESQFMDLNLKRMGFFAQISMKISGMHRKNLAHVATSAESVGHRLDVARRLLLTDLAVQLYRQQHGEAPPDLNALVPAIVKSVPIDPYTDKPLRYQKRGKDSIVYSFGPDRDDDKLTKTLGQRHSETDDGDYTIDSF